MRPPADQGRGRSVWYRADAASLLVGTGARASARRSMAFNPAGRILKALRFSRFRRNMGYLFVLRRSVNRL